jgi:hypothetical protein
MRKNRWLLLGLLLACTVGIALAALAWMPRPGVNKQNFDRIEVGMTRAEVEAIFAGPAKFKRPNSTRALLSDEWWSESWSEDNELRADSARIVFDETNNVCEKDWWGIWRDERPFWERAQDHLPWRKKPPPAKTYTYPNLPDE